MQESNNIKHYNNMQFNDVPTTLEDIVYNKTNIIHNQIYSKALNKYIDDNNIDKTKYKFIEIKSKSYNDASKVLKISIKKPYTKEIVSLDDYWNYYQTYKQSKSLDNLYIDEDTIKDAEIIYMDYVNGRVKLKSRFTGTSFWTDFDYINSDTKYADSMKLTNTPTKLKYVELNNGLTMIN